MQFLHGFFIALRVVFRHFCPKHLARKGITAITENTLLFLNSLHILSVLTNHLQKITNFDFSIFALTNTYKVTGYIFFFLYS